MITTKLNNGVTVLAKTYKGQIYPMTFANFTQAKAAAARNGSDDVRCYGRPFYVCFPNTSPASDVSAYVSEGLGETADFCASDNN